MRRLLPLILAAFLTACGPAMVWDRPFTSDAALHADQQECRQMARQQAFAETWPRYGAGIGYRGWYDRHGRYYRDPFPYDPFFEREQREASLSDFCMRARGYRLTPVQTGTS
ncbi:hypothetical protein [Ferrovibrio sp.]|uniref:hypothetical protein n=1 Tax=Ferrovibrio sp. TaxID=1917215 RepID=UPI003D2E96FD